MKKLLLVAATLMCLNGYAQSDSKNEVYSKIESSYAWINYQMLETYATINMSEAHWAWVLKNEHYGLSSVNTLGGDLANFYEIVGDERILSDCRYSNTESCKDRINNMSKKVFVEMNTSNMKMEERSLKLALHALSTIGNFLGTENIYGTKAGWRPKTNNTKFVLNIDNGTGQPKVSWNTDGSVVTITMFVGAEAADWRANLLDKLNKGK